VTAVLTPRGAAAQTAEQAAQNGAVTYLTHQEGFLQAEVRMNSIMWLQDWYLEQCDDAWEHQYGIAIETLDNPGWVVRIDLTGTAMQGVSMEETRRGGGINHEGVGGTQDWLHCKVDADRFVGAGGPSSLFSICDTFKAWVEQRAGTSS